MSLAAKITVLGAGSYGTALAICLARNGHKTLLWGRDDNHVAAMEQDRENNKYLADCPFPENLALEADLEKAVQASDNLLVVVPSHAFADMLKQIKPMLTENAKIAWATKGLDPQTGDLLQNVARTVLGDRVSLAVLSGPTFAKEMASGLPTAISLSSEDDEFVAELSDLLHCEKRFRVYSNKDFIGVQLGGAVKNVIAIAAGIADGIGFGANARTALITRGLAEMTRLGLALNAEPATFMGMAGLGDLVLTCTDNQSRNRRFGLALGQGKEVEQAITDIGQVVEGYRNTKEVYMLAQRHDVEMPIVEQVYQVLYRGKDAKLAAADLLSRDKKFE
ncbi:MULTISPECIES: NAD(P)H-dependent glycerol-3-phosphate dehydrogenase [Colwellia]|uniref:Glycerol-3-phosphate dehydrogenase [NAD(P)+] n=1 Tax=Colwellia psychrerythraea (strain 34H / ATCC BAA-681) TaxID=167879 RepID=GPDA_COLP3|nr:MULTISPECIES: NAD(P)H-dependent glycerol-3-phosphate dehydrogenase [Colwellia]Q47VY6.1 RecName: Full=Glycerol-3-phosphate dehydrogenase [NAD(P)+]; AltName: Full=NAD(P)H-dependent glycerol-3-phosphate dehydrogenase [Colwellia psychrerythraea 34H]AAZ25009.1 glycerol-3-phosphate dehydrogenase (NAD(P)+) [Colwellia psychrerythraea 34H]PKH85552.1 glycerol-3-phosphate dehydrogenase (NAD(P)(+)) [Colwellia sp. Bg11-28]